jgi:hypothetical protein
MSKWPQNGKNQLKKISFLVVLDHLYYKNDLVRGLFLSLGIGLYIVLTCVSFGPLGKDKMASKRQKNSMKNWFSGCFGPFLIKE